MIRILIVMLLVERAASQILWDLWGLPLPDCEGTCLKNILARVCYAGMSVFEAGAIAYFIYTVKDKRFRVFLYVFLGAAIYNVYEDIFLQYWIHDPFEYLSFGAGLIIGIVQYAFFNGPAKNRKEI